MIDRQVHWDENFPLAGFPSLQPFTPDYNTVASETVSSQSFVLAH
jgi:hypothetical protein